MQAAYESRLRGYCPNTSALRLSPSIRQCPAGIALQVLVEPRNRGLRSAVGIDDDGVLRQVLNRPVREPALGLRPFCARYGGIGIRDMQVRNEEVAGVDDVYAEARRRMRPGSDRQQSDGCLRIAQRNGVRHGHDIDVPVDRGKSVARHLVAVERCFQERGVLGGREYYRVGGCECSCAARVVVVRVTAVVVEIEMRSVLLETFAGRLMQMMTQDILERLSAFA